MKSYKKISLLTALFLVVFSGSLFAVESGGGDCRYYGDNAYDVYVCGKKVGSGICSKDNPNFCLEISGGNPAYQWCGPYFYPQGTGCGTGGPSKPFAGFECSYGYDCWHPNQYENGLLKNGNDNDSIIYAKDIPTGTRCTHGNTIATYCINFDYCGWITAGLADHFGFRCFPENTCVPGAQEHRACGNNGGYGGEGCGTQSRTCVLKSGIKIYDWGAWGNCTYLKSL